MITLMNRRKLSIGFVAFFASCATMLGSDRAKARPVDEFEILTGFSSKESCSCAFVVEQSDEYCQAFGQLAGYPATVTIDRAAKTVTSSFGGVTRKAIFTDGAGCLSEDLAGD